MDDPAGDVPRNIVGTDGWQSVLADMSATADSYRDRGWSALELHPGDAVLVDTDDRTGLDVLLPGDEYEELEGLVDENSFGDVEVFAAESGGVIYLLIVERDPVSETAVFVPAYYERSDPRGTLETIRTNGRLRVFCRRLNNDYVVFEHTDLGPFLPDAVADE
ncbi:DUF7529 family protein [Halovivax limisalsi]|uniref:DUF7529 family protein n=1 Tax=Halovivax limisalsi TaxID=1453760 RepID=UPI001FFC7BF2|nr:hypothetical protein [Halovivax limisalsi]